MANKQAGCRLCSSNGIDIQVKTKEPQDEWWFSSDPSAGLAYCPECGRPFNLRPMTLAEAVKYEGPVWEEVRTKKVMEFGWWRLPDQVRGGRPPYRCRYWPSKPTPEQSAAWKWEEEETNHEC